MESKELRIGNLVYFEDEILKFEFESGWNFDFIKPIPLTDEWLLKLGANRFNNAFLIDRFRLIPMPQYGFYQVVDKETNAYFSKVEFVHEWQNLYFALTQKELVYEKTV